MNSAWTKALGTPALLMISGAMQTLTLAPFDWWYLGPVSVALLLYATKALEPDTKPRSWQHGWFYGVGLFGAGVSWVYVSINTYGNASPFLAGLLTLIFVAGLALFQVFQFWLYYRLRTRFIALNALLFLAVWVLSDAFRTDFLTGFPWIFLGYAHIESPLSGWAPLVGVYGITAIVVASGVALSLVQRRASLSLRTGWVGVSLVLWLLPLSFQDTEWTQASDNTLKVTLLQTNIPQELKWQSAQRRKTLRLLEDMSSEAWDSDIILWPETAVPMLMDQAKPLLDRFDHLAKQHEVNIITGIPYRERDELSGETRLHNSILSLGDGSGINHKQKLVPFGEYVPMQDVLRGLIDFFDLPMSDFRRGPSQQPLINSKNYQAAAFICYEVVYPDFVAARAKEADYLITVSNDAWFGTSIGPLQHLQMAQMRALENGRYMLRGTNNGITAIINEKGHITASAEQFVQTHLTGELKLFSGRTPYNVVKSYPLFLLATAFVFFIALVGKRWRPKQKDSTND